AYEISRDWSSDVCSSDLRFSHGPCRERAGRGLSRARRFWSAHINIIGSDPEIEPCAQLDAFRHSDAELVTPIKRIAIKLKRQVRSEERRVGKEGRLRGPK